MFGMFDCDFEGTCMTNESLQALLEKQLAFYHERDWEQFHSPKNLVMNLTTEVGELVEPFRWLTETQSRELDKKTSDAVAQEIADVFMILLHLSHSLGIDPVKASLEKLEAMAEKYPVNKSRGKALKYTEYQKQSQKK